MVDAGKAHDIFEVLEATDGIVRVKTPFLFEIGEELAVRVERNGTTADGFARVRAHVDLDGDKVTELELADPSEPRRGESG
jgi:hypothetical protein